MLKYAGILVLVGLLGAGGLVGYARFRLGRHHVVPCAACRSTDGATAPMNVLVLGSDRRPGDTGAGQRADTIALLHVDFKTSKAILVNLPRDLRVKAPNGDAVKINSFYNDGPTAMVQAVTSFTGIPVDHYVEVNFTGFRNIVNTIGGVRIRFSQAVDDSDSGLNVPAGCVTLNGDQALAFVRVRHLDSDYGRIARQQFFVQLVMKQVLSAGTLLNPLKVINLVNVGAGNVTTDNGLGAGTIEKLALELRNFTPKTVDFRVVPSQPQTIEGVSYVIPFAGQSAALFDAIKNVTTLPDYGKQGSPIAPSTVNVTILNGTSTQSVTALAQAELQAAGYPVVATGSADATTYAATVVYYTPGNVDKASLLAQVYGEAQVQPLPSQFAARGAGGDAVVVLGQDYAQGKVTAVPSAPASPVLPAGPATPLPTSALEVAAC
ncbi:MAG TPA: LCP family protein [Actinomycetota bacterium]|nr:LCP family protein [Actinomycetota bacterium]